MIDEAFRMTTTLELGTEKVKIWETSGIFAVAWDNMLGVTS